MKRKKSSQSLFYCQNKKPSATMQKAFVSKSIWKGFRNEWDKTIFFRLQIKHFQEKI